MSTISLQAQCRICFESEISESELIQPCMCKGSSQYVHRHCLNNWMNTVPYSPLNILRDNDKRCEICHEYYQFETITTPEIKYNNLKIFIDMLILTILFHIFGFLFGILITLNGTYVIYWKTSTYLYMYVFGNLVSHFIVGLFLLLSTVCSEDVLGMWFCYCPSNNCGEYDSCGGVIMLLVVFITTTIGLMYIFFLVYDDAYKKAKERQSRVQTIRMVKDLSVPQV